MNTFHVQPFISVASRFTIDSPANSSTQPVYVCQCLVAGLSGTLGRRELLQRRMPPREGIQAIIDRLRSNPDPWLEDEYD
jgi:hypothetical protein